MNARTLAATATAEDARRAPRSAARSYVAGSGAVTKDERRDLAASMRAGKLARTREAAVSILRTVDALRADGRSVTEADYLLSSDFLDEYGEPQDARAVLAEAEERAKRRGRWTLADERRMTYRDAVSIAGYAARCMSRMSRPKLTEDEWDDARHDALAALLERGGGGGLLPLWSALDRADVDETSREASAKSATREVGIRARQRVVSTTADARRDLWRGWAYMTGRKLSAARHERLSTEIGADFTDAGDDAPTDAQAVALAAEAAEAARLALESVDPSTVDALAATAPGEDPLSGAERDALWMRLAGMTRADLAAARGVSADSVKKNAQRGGKLLAARVPTEGIARRWASDAATADVDEWDRALALVTERERVQASGRITSGARKLPAWPPRVGRMEADTYVIPAAPTGAGESARHQLSAHCATPWRPWQHAPRVTRSGAPALPAHRLLAPLARTLRTLAAITLPPVSSATADHYAPHPRHAPTRTPLLPTTEDRADTAKRTANLARLAAEHEQHAKRLHARASEGHGWAVAALERG